jgi:hypothetical protein
LNAFTTDGFSGGEKMSLVLCSESLQANNIKPDSKKTNLNVILNFFYTAAPLPTFLGKGKTELWQNFVIIYRIILSKLLAACCQPFFQKFYTMKNNFYTFIFQYTLLTSFLLLPPALASAHGVSHTDQEMLVGGSLLNYIFVGAKHMLTGYDHLLFLTGVVFFLRNTRDILLFITAFTLGHSITLICATLLGISANDHLIDAVIALSVVYKGFENLDGFKRWLNTDAPNLLYMVFAFGLIHGFGLSTRLQQLSVGSEATFSKIVAFNVGVELGQVAALIPILFLINLWRKHDSFTTFESIVNWGLVAAGVGLFLYQIIGYAGHLG